LGADEGLGKQRLTGGRIASYSPALITLRGWLTATRSQAEQQRQQQEQYRLGHFVLPSTAT
jgi:hypothetical protein